ncbi:MAG: ankyrin repeat domain-containing protein [Saccharospirillaceae bacterium]|nr:ankyrin repeat domain-containing protein [Pseudomonadales bacterium]NRB77092.1 ankyrin repeat domain-containing protein [Saccharospirillaceae bacterium]
MIREDRVHTPLTLAILDNDLATVYALSLVSDLGEVNNYNETPLFFAIIRDNLDATKILLEGGADPVPKNPSLSKWTPITWVSAFAQVEILELLIQHGVDVNNPDGVNIYPIDWASRVLEECGETEAYEILVNAGADISNIRRRNNIVKNKK